MTIVQSDDKKKEWNGKKITLYAYSFSQDVQVTHFFIPVTTRSISRSCFRSYLFGKLGFFGFLATPLVFLKASYCSLWLLFSLTNGLLYTWTEDSRLFYLKSERVGILKNGSNIICTSLKNEDFLFYARVCGTKIKPAMPCLRLNLSS